MESPIIKTPTPPSARESTDLRGEFGILQGEYTGLRGEFRCIRGDIAMRLFQALDRLTGRRKRR